MRSLVLTIFYIFLFSVCPLFSEESDSSKLFRSVSVQTEEAHVIVAYNLAKKVSDIGLFRSTRPFKMKTDLNNVTLVSRSPGKAGYNVLYDQPIAGIKYFYALASLKDLRDESFTLESAYLIKESILIPYSDISNSRNKRIYRETPLPSLLMESAVPAIDDKMQKPHPLLLDIVNGTLLTEVPEPLILSNSQLRMPSNFKRLVERKSWEQCIRYLHEIENSVQNTPKEIYLDFYLSMFYALDNQREEAFFYLLKCSDLDSEELNEWKAYIYSFTLSL